MPAKHFVPSTFASEFLVWERGVLCLLVWPGAGVLGAARTGHIDPRDEDGNEPVRERLAKSEWSRATRSLRASARGSSNVNLCVSE